MTRALGVLRLRALEYGPPARLSAEICDATRLDATASKKLLAAAGDRAAKTLRRSEGLIEFSSAGERPVDFAGILRVGANIELEVAPKFLGQDDVAPTWREDFFFLATLSRHGSLLLNERLASSASGSHRDLSTLVGQAVATMYRDNERRPLRTYRVAREIDFSIDGDVDAIDFRYPSADGFEQEILRYDRRNPFNAAIRAAADDLAAEVSDPGVQAKLRRVVDGLAPQRRPGARMPRRVPSRSRVWQPLHTLSLDVLDGFGLRYKPGQASAPGYVVDTWRVWQDLLELAARLGFGAAAVTPQKGFALGERRRPENAKASKLNVVPDVFVRGKSGHKFVIDAKYKTNASKGKISISESDVYESLAFAQAADAKLVILAYPTLSNAAPTLADQLGETTLFETITVETVKIVGVMVNCRGISRRRGLKDFSNTYAIAIARIAETSIA